MPHNKRLVKTVPVNKDEDLTTLTKGQLTFFAFFVGLFGFAIPLPFPKPGLAAILLALPLPAALIIVSLFRNKIVVWVASYGFVRLFRLDSLMSKIFYASSAFIALVFYPSFLGLYSLPVWALPLAAPWFFVFEYVGQSVTLFESEWKKGKLSILQFLKESEDRDPKEFWVRYGLRIAEKRLLKFGLYVPRNRLFFGVSYALFQGDNTVNANLATLSEWLVEPQADTIRPILRQILSYSRQAKELDLEVAPTLREKLAKLPWTIIGIGVAIFGLIIEIVRLTFSRSG